MSPMETTLISTALTQVQEARCTKCTRPVLRVLLEGRAVSLETREIECPRMPCPECTTRTGRHKGRAVSLEKPCERCHGTGIVGVRYPHHAIAVDADGVAHHWLRTTRRKSGEGLYVPHTCGIPDEERISR